MADQVIRCVLCRELLAVVADISATQTLKIAETIRTKKVDKGGVIICPKCWALTPIDEEILKKLPLEP